MSFETPIYFVLLLLLLPLSGWFFFHLKKRQATLKFATTKGFRKAPKSFRTRLVYLPYLLRAFCFIALVTALAHPQIPFQEHEIEREGIDIMLTMDISTSMLTNDLEPSRIEAAKKVAHEFITNRPNDNIGLTLFAGEAFLQCPLTTDHSILLQQFRMISCSMAEYGIIAPGTAIGMGLSNAIVHLEKSKASSKIIVLLTDGANNTGEISPLTAAEIAKKEGIRVYTISVGENGKSLQSIARLPNGESYEAEIENAYDPETLKAIAQQTGGAFYRATSIKELRDIYKDIDQLEKSKQRVKQYSHRKELFPYFVAIAFLFLFSEIILRITWLRRLF